MSIKDLQESHRWCAHLFVFKDSVINALFLHHGLCGVQLPRTAVNVNYKEVWRQITINEFHVDYNKK